MNKKFVYCKRYNEVWEILDEKLEFVMHKTYRDLATNLRFYVVNEEDLVDYIPSKLFLKLYAD
jgi:hypothetical protein